MAGLPVQVPAGVLPCGVVGVSPTVGAAAVSLVSVPAIPPPPPPPPPPLLRGVVVVVVGVVVGTVVSKVYEARAEEQPEARLPLVCFA